MLSQPSYGYIGLDKIFKQMLLFQKTIRKFVRMKEVETISSSLEAAWQQKNAYTSIIIQIIPDTP